jgi:3'(2'), 5'-bisphosphate nucleotidase
MIRSFNIYKHNILTGLLDHVTCLIGIGARGHSVAGIINQPYYNYKEGPDAKLGRCIWGIIGLGKK